MIAVENEKKMKDRCKYCNHMAMLLLLGANYRLPLFHMAKRFIWINETKQINEFKIGYMINTGLNVNKTFIGQVETYIFTTFGAIK